MPVALQETKSRTEKRTHVSRVPFQLKEWATWFIFIDLILALWDENSPYCSQHD